MPRPRNPFNETQRSAQERWRERIRAAGRPEVDLVDSAITVAAAIFTNGVKDRPPTSAARQRAEAIQRIAVRYLVSLGKDQDEAFRMVYKRLHPLNIDQLAKLAEDGDVPVLARPASPVS
jgi:hypothetical protein